MFSERRMSVNPAMFLKCQFKNRVSAIRRNVEYLLACVSRMECRQVKQGLYTVISGKDWNAGAIIYFTLRF
jgi:hypothetical protein